MQQFTGSRSRKRSVLAGPLSCDAEASDVFCRTSIIAAAASAARCGAHSDAILPWAPAGAHGHVGRTVEPAAGHSTLVRRVEMRPVVFVFAAAFGLAVTAASAGDYKAGSLDISSPWSRATPKGSSVAAGYVKITNSGSAPDRLIGRSPGVASKF